ncbi:unnamed protein product [Pleuronectes platessa]|uniref:Uncharacterized protein n=1 Tax=Pleuronectes platessa TaxID=8262 RepID=A0A9N7Z8E7_PLEPL|nr:unnamed protein product [Pleuronectes platessa]
MAALELPLRLDERRRERLKFTGNKKPKDAGHLLLLKPNNRQTLRVAQLLLRSTVDRCFGPVLRDWSCGIKKASVLFQVSHALFGRYPSLILPKQVAALLQSAVDSLQQCVPELAPVVLCYAGLESEMTARTSMMQMQMDSEATESQWSVQGAGLIVLQREKVEQSRLRFSTCSAAPRSRCAVSLV